MADYWWFLHKDKPELLKVVLKGEGNKNPHLFVLFPIIYFSLFSIFSIVVNKLWIIMEIIDKDEILSLN